MSDPISTDSVQPGDVILCHGVGWLPRMIRFFDGTEVNHAAICTGSGQVGEALANGLSERALSARFAVEADQYLLVRRLKVRPDTMDPVLQIVRSYLKTGNRYAYEQLVLLALLGLTRQIPLNGTLRFILRRVLDAAASFVESLLTHTIGDSREPMICSEFVYRCYDEALPQAGDIYSIDVEAVGAAAGSRGVAGAGVVVPGELRVRGVHPESLLLWSLSRSGQHRGPARSRRAVRRGKKVDLRKVEAELEPLANEFFDELQSGAVSTRALSRGASDDELLAAIQRFALAHHAASHGAVHHHRRSAARDISPMVVGAVPDALQHLLRTCQDFVTPGDLYRTESLMGLGRIDPASREFRRRSVVAAAAARAATPAKRALVVGINNYPDPRNHLNGCVNDALMMAEILTGHFGFKKDDVRLLVDRRATTENMRERLRWLVAGATQGSVLVFHYSGHGSQVRDRDGDELNDRLDEIICPYDLDWDDPITDDELGRFIGEVPAGVDFTLVLDCCHSGSGTREFFKEPTLGRAPASKYLTPPPDIGFRAAKKVAIAAVPERSVSMVGNRVASRRHFGTAVTKQNGLLVAACRADQTSSDAYINNDYHGALTYSLWTTLSAANFSMSNLDLIRGAGEWLESNEFDQVPQVEGPRQRLRRTFLG